MITLTINEFYEQTIPQVVSPPVYILEYTVSWASTDTTPINLLTWGPEGTAQDVITPASLTIADGVASVQRTVLVNQTNAYVPLIQDPNFVISHWTTQALTLQPGTYALTTNAATITIDGFPYTSGASFTVQDSSKINLVLTGAPTNVSITGTPVYPPVIPVLNEETPAQIIPADFFPFYVVVTDANDIVLAASYLVQELPVVGSPQSRNSQLIVTPLDTTLTPIPTSPLQPSSLLNN